MANRLSSPNPVSDTRQAPSGGFRVTALHPRPEGRGFTANLINQQNPLNRDFDSAQPTEKRSLSGVEGVS